QLMADLWTTHQMIPIRDAFYFEGLKPRDADTDSIGGGKLFALGCVVFQRGIGRIKAIELLPISDSQGSHVIAAIMETFFVGNLRTKQRIVERERLIGNPWGSSGSRNALCPGEQNGSRHVFNCQFLT